MQQQASELAAKRECSASQLAAVSSGPTANSLKLHCLDARRAQNITIGLVPFNALCGATGRRRGDFAGIFEAVCRLDDVGGRLDHDALENLGRLLPSPSELKRLHGAGDSEHVAERFVLSAQRYMPELHHRIATFTACLAFPSMYQEAVVRRKEIVRACDAILQSHALSLILTKMLAMANVVNSGPGDTAMGTGTGLRTGITRTSLLHMIEYRGHDDRTSILDLVVKSALVSGDAQTLMAEEELSRVPFVKVSQDKMERDGQHIAGSLASLSANLARVQALSTIEGAIQGPCGGASSAATNKAFEASLEDYLRGFNRISDDFGVLSERMAERVMDVIEYFGEVPGECPLTDVFETIGTFVKAIKTSRESMERQLRSNINKGSRK